MRSSTRGAGRGTPCARANAENAPDHAVSTAALEPSPSFAPPAKNPRESIEAVHGKCEAARATRSTSAAPLDSPGLKARSTTSPASVFNRHVSSALASIDDLTAKGRLEEIEIPVLVGIPEKDLLVPPRDQRAAAERLRQATTVEVAGSLHEPLMERDEIRGPFVARITSFFAGIADGLPEDAGSNAFRKVAALMRRE